MEIQPVMQTIYLVRHTTPAVAKGICYGQSDLDVTGSFADEAAIIRECLRKQGFWNAAGAVDTCIYSSPLQRCRKLADHLFPQATVCEADELKEIHCGQWEMNYWDAIPREETDPWMKDFVNTRIPGGESYLDLYGRVVDWFKAIRDQGGERAVLFSHGGVIRSILSFVTDTPLADSFKAFALHYGCTIRLTRKGGESGFRYEFLSNIQPAEKEQHKPGTGSTFVQSDPL